MYTFDKATQLIQNPIFRPHSSSRITLLASETKDDNSLCDVASEH